MKTCADCVHEYACKVWTNGRVLADENAAKCPEFKTVRDTASYLIGKMEGEKTALSGVWIPVTPETMPPYTEYGASADLILRIREDDHVDVYTGYYQDGRWYTYMRGGTDIISEEIVVTHWMYADDLLKGAEENG